MNHYYPIIWPSRTFSTRNIHPAAQLYYVEAPCFVLYGARAPLWLAAQLAQSQGFVDGLDGSLRLG